MSDVRVLNDEELKGASGGMTKAYGVTIYTINELRNFTVGQAAYCYVQGYKKLEPVGKVYFYNMLNDNVAVFHDDKGKYYHIVSGDVYVVGPMQ